MQGIAINEIEGALINKFGIGDFELCESRGDQGLFCEYSGYNQALDAQGQVRLTLDREKTAKFLYDKFYFGKSGSMIKLWEDATEWSKKVFYEEADALNANLKDLITVVKEN